MKRSPALENNHRQPPEPPAPPTDVAFPVPFHPGESAMEETMAQLTSEVLHSTDRTPTQHCVLVFLAHAQGPTAEGVAQQLGLAARRVASALAALEAAGLAWSRPEVGRDAGWHLSQDGRYYLGQRNLVPQHPAA